MPFTRRARWATVATILVACGMLPASGVAKAPRCRGGQTKVRVTYVKRKGGPKRHATGCAPREGAIPDGVPAALPKALAAGRRLALELAPKIVRRARRTRAGKRVLRADTATDAAAARQAASLARASDVTHGTDTRSVDGPPGTRSTTTGRATDWSRSEARVGREVHAVVDTTSTRLAGSSSKKRKSIDFKYLMDRCPDSGGLGRGTVSYAQRDVWTTKLPSGGRVTLTERGTFEGEVVAHLGDDARIASVDVNGTWSWTTDTVRSDAGRVGHHAVGGGVATESFRQSDPNFGPVTSHVDIAPTVVTGSDDETAVSGHYIGRFAVVMPDEFVEEMLDGLQNRALSGACVRVEPDETTVHVTPASTARIVAHLVDSAGATFSGPMTTTNERVSPQRAEGSPDAQFTYAAAASPPPGGYDVVSLEHISRRGKASTGSVKVVYDSYTYRVQAAVLDETVTGERPADPGFGGCPPSGRQTNEMRLGPQPLDPNSSDGRLIDDGPNRSGQIRATGTASFDTVMQGCNVADDPPDSCTGTGSFQDDRDVTIEVELPKAGGDARVQWFFNKDPSAGLGNESSGSCLTPVFHGHTDNDALGTRSVPRAVFESGSPSTLSIEIQLDLPNDQGGQVHATERYSLTIQRVREDGTPL